jgi:hypothetical protein
VRVLIFDGNLKAFGGKFVLAWTWRLTFFLLHASCFHFFFRERAFCPRCKRGKQVPSSLLSVRLNLTAVRNLFFFNGLRKVSPKRPIAKIEERSCTQPVFYFNEKLSSKNSFSKRKNLRER